MKMPRSHSENENVQFVQELAEVDGPFESPININFRDLTKLELPSLVWNRSDACPKKMKVTNTGHTVIVSGKWKNERPFLTGGPLLGKYVFSQIHFHWGQDDCKGSEHLICGEGFPLEMHVAHFKADYISQECALKEKDGMVVLVYLFKLQDEPNMSLKKILNTLSAIKEANSSQPLDPRPILSLCNPFTDDYFLYWGSVVTSTCAHILMWLVCREPFGISKDQVSEFRKILDSAQQPICRNNRETQPLHKRNVFHVNASKNLDGPLLPIKKIVGCFCGKGSEDNESVNSSKDCCCKGSVKDQEDVQGGNAESNVGSLHMVNEGGEPTCKRKGSQLHNYHVHQSLVVQRATVQSAPLLPKLFENTYIGQLWPTGSIKDTNMNTNAITSANANANTTGDSTAKLISQSCCFIPIKEVYKVKSRQEKRRIRNKSFNSMRALSHIMDSLEALKNQTCKKLKEIDSINQQIKGMKTFCQQPEDKRWLKRIEKIMSRQKRFTIKSSQGCFVELKKLAKDCNLEQLFENKFSSHSESTKITLTNTSTTARVFTRSKIVSSTETTRKIQSRSLTMDKALKFPSKAQKLIQAFFEDIHDSEELHQTLKKDLGLKKKKSLSPTKSKRLKESSSTTLGLRRGYITKKMFNMGNLGDRFFIEVKSNDTIIPEERGWGEPDLHSNRLFVSVDGSRTDNPNRTESDLVTKLVTEETSFSTVKPPQEDIIPLHRADIAVGFACQTQRSQPLVKRKKGLESEDENREPSIADTFTDNQSDSSSVTSYVDAEPKGKSYVTKGPNESLSKKECHLSKEYSFDQINSERVLTALRNLTSSTDSTTTQRMIIAKFHKRQSREEIRNQKSSLVLKTSSMGLYPKISGKRPKTTNFNFEGYYIKKKNKKMKKFKDQTDRSDKGPESSGEFSSVSKEDIYSPNNKSRWKSLTKARFKLKIEKTSDSTIESAIGCSIMSPAEAKIRLSSRKGRKEGSEECERPIDGIIVEELQHTSRRDKVIRIHETVIPTTREQVGICSSRSRPLSRPLSRASTKRSTRISSKDSKTSSPEKPPLLPQKDFFRNGVLNVRRTTNNRSFTSLSGRFKTHSSDPGKGIFTQTNDGASHLAQENLDHKRKWDTLRGTELAEKGTEKEIEIKMTSRQDLADIIQTEDIDDLVGGQNQRTQDFEVGFFTTPRHKRNEKLLSETYIQNGGLKLPKNIGLRCDIEKYHFLDKELHEIKGMAQNDCVVQQESKESPDNLIKSDSNKSLASNGPDMKGDANVPAPDPKDLPPTVSYTTIKKSSQSRPHSVESLTSLTKSCKRKRKKRPHCSKRISRHHMRKNSCVFRKPNRVDSKPINFLNLTDEEQLKIISENVAKYLKQKFGEKKRNSDVQKQPKTHHQIEHALELQMERKNDDQIESLQLQEQTVQQPLKTQIEQETINHSTEDHLNKEVQQQLDQRVQPPSEKGKEGKEKEEETHKQNDQENQFQREQHMDQEIEQQSNNQKNWTLEHQLKQEVPQIVQNSQQKSKERPPKQFNETKLPLPVKRIFEPEKFYEDAFSKLEDVTQINLTNKASTKIKKPNSPRPPHPNYIKLNKLMAGRYRKQNSMESKSDSGETPKKPDDPKAPEMQALATATTPFPPPAPPTPPKKTPPLKPAYQKRPGSTKSNLPVRAPDNKINKKPPKGNQTKNPQLKKDSEDADNEKLKKKSHSLVKKTPEDKKTKEAALPEVPILEKNAVQNSQSLMTLDNKLPLEKTPSSLIPTYMMTSYVTPSIDLSESSQKINPFLINLKKKNINSCLPEMLYDTQNYYYNNNKTNDTIYAKDLENLIKLQMCLNNEIASNIENSMNYIKTLLSQDYNGTAIVEKAPVDDGLTGYDASHNGIVLIEMNDMMDCSTSGSDCGEETERYAYQTEGNFNTKFHSKINQILNPNGSIPKEYGDSKLVKAPFPTTSPDLDEEYYSDSSYNCEISITLNGNPEESPPFHSQATEKAPLEHQANRSVHLLRRDSNSSQITTQLEGGHSSQSIILKPLRKKRKDNEISMEMKKKLLEILEGEIRREMSLNYQASSENSSDALTLRWDESTNRSQSLTESSSDNTEVLAQISETMRQYLSEYKKRRLVKKNLDAPDKSKSEDDS